MPSATTQGVLGHPDPVDQQRDQLQAGQVGGQQHGQRSLGAATNRREIADLEVPELAWSARLPTGSSPTR
jgi:hypothetical protein